MIQADADKCIGCKLCELACSIHHEDVINPKKARLRISGDYETGWTVHICDACGVCFEACPVDAIKKIEGEETHYRIDEEECTNCGKCIEVCPRDAVFLHRDFESPVICDLCGVCIDICPKDVLYIER